MDTSAYEEMPPHDVSLVDLSTLRSLDGSKTSKWLQNEERKTVNYLLAIRNLMNSRALVNRLPEELLGMIILTTMKLVKTKNQNGRRFRSYTWIWLTHFCRFWRDVAVRQTQLWDFIDVTKPDRARIFMQRSKTIPVQVFFKAPASGFSLRAEAEVQQKVSNLIHLIKPNCHRISALTISISESTMEDAFSGLTFPLSGIRELNLTIFEDFKGLGWGPLTPLVYDPVMDPNQHPLRRLSLSGVVIPFTSSYYRGLEELVLYNQRPNTQHNPRHTPTLSTFLDVLESCPRLTRIELHRAGPTIETAGTVPKGRLVELPNLRHISLRNGSEDAALLLSHLRFPSTITIDIYYDFDSQQEVGLLSIFPPRFNRPNFLSSLSSLHIQCERDTQFASAIGNSLHPGTLKLDLAWDVSWELYPQKIGQLVRSVPLLFAGSPVMRLYIEGDLEEVSLGNWQALFREFSDIVSIHFLSRGVWGDGWNPEKRFLKALSVCDETPGSQLGGNRLAGKLLCPKLDTVELELFRIEPGWDQRLRKCLSSRMEKGAPKLSTLHLMEPVWLEDKEAFEWPDLTDLCEKFLHPKYPLGSD